MKKYTDAFGNPLKPGDLVAYPVCLNSSGSQLKLSEIVWIEDLVKMYPNDPTDDRGYRYSQRLLKPTSRVAYHLVGKMDGINFIPDESKMFVMRVRRIRDGYLQDADDINTEVLIKKVDRVIRVTDMVHN